MKKTIATFIFIHGMHFCVAQYSIAYYWLAYKADSLYKAKNYKLSAETYSEAFKLSQCKSLKNDVYGAACSWALAGYPDSAFYYLKQAGVVNKFNDYAHVVADEDLVVLHNDARWVPTIEIIRENKEVSDKFLNKALAKELDTIYYDDQKYRGTIFDSVAKKHDYKPDSMQDFKNMMYHQDSIDLVKVEAILSKYGWLGPDSIGEPGTVTLWVVIQHADLKTQEKYLPMMKDAVKNGKARPQDLAYLEDRIEMGNRRPQIFGTQYILGYDGTMKFYKIGDKKAVDSLRAQMGLIPLEIVARRWKIKMDD